MIAPQSGPSHAAAEPADAWSRNSPPQGWAQLVGRRREQILFVVVGCWNTLFGYCVWALLEYALHDHLHYVVILALSWPISLLNAYVCYRFIVFRSRGSVFRELPRFALVYAFSLVLGLIALPILVNTLPFSIYVSWAGFTAAMVVVTYLAHKFFSFGGGRRRSPAPVDEGQE